MQRSDPVSRRAGARRLTRLIAALPLSLAASFAAPFAVAADSAPLRFSAPIVIKSTAPFVQLDLTPDVYGHVDRPDLGDLRVVDAHGERAPFAILEPRSTLRASEPLREATLYPLPARPSAAGVWSSPVDVVVDGDRISVSRHGGPPAARSAAMPESGGWLIDLGPARPGDAAPTSLRLRWSGPAEFSATYQLEASDDLRQWREAGAGQLMALQSATGALSQPVVSLPGQPARFLRLVWGDAGGAPIVTGASVLAPERHLVALDTAREITVAAGAEPAGGTTDAATAADRRRAVHFDLGAVLPIVDVDLRFTAGNHVAPVRLQGRAGVDEPWRELGAGVFYRLQRGASVGEAPAIALQSTLRYLRVIADERAAAVVPAQVRLVVRARLASLVFAAQGEPPFRLLAGSRDAAAGALPAATLVPGLDDERQRFGRAELGAFAVNEAALREAERADRSARLRPWLLWSVLLVGVLGLGALVFRLAKTGAAKS